jgi:hypothetical protein
MNRSLIRTYVRTILREDYEGLGDGGEQGLEFGSPSKLYKVFLEPFADVFQTAAGKGKELSQKVQTLGKTAFEAVGTTLLPTFKSNYDKIRADEKMSLDKIKSQYAPVYKRAWDAIQDNDILSAAWMYDPVSMVTSTVLKHAPTQVFNMLNVLAGGALDKLKKQAGGNDKGGVFKKIFTELGGVQERADRYGNLLIEDSSLMLNSKIKELIDNNDDVMNMRSNTKKTMRASLEKVFDETNSIMKARSIEDLQKLLGKNVPALKKVMSLQEPERSQIEQSVLKATKESIKAFNVQKLKERAQEAIKAGVPEDHPMISDIKSTIGKVNAAS